MERQTPRTLLLSATFSLLVGLTIPERALAEPPTGSSDELLVKFHSGVARSSAKEALRGAGAEPVEEIGKLRIHRVRTANGHGANVMDRLRRRGDVEFVEVDAAHAPAEVPNDPEYVNQWHLPKISAPSAWSVTHGAGIVIAILDSGVESTHPDLAAKIVPGWNFYNGNADTSDVYGHGTKVAGAAAAASNNSVGVAGVAWSASLMPIRVTDTAGYGYTSSMASGITWAVDHGARVVNLSFETMASSSAVRTAAQYAMSKGALVVVAAGNCGCDDPTPENPYVLSVGATNAVDGLMSFSARGAFVDVVAPGTMIRTTARGGTYVSTAGTSFASPVVAGVAALVMAANPTASPDQVVAWLEDTALDLGAAGHDFSFGFGRVDASFAVAEAASNPAPAPVDTTTPSATITAPSAGAVVSGNVNVAVAAFDNVAVAKVELWVDGQLVASDSSSPYSFSWSSSSVADGVHTLVAIAQDPSGNRGNAAAVGVTVANQVDLLPPVAFIDSPLPGTSVSRTVTIKARATDDGGLTTLKVLVDGQTLGSGSCSGLTCTLSVKWNVKQIAKGSHAISAQAVDRAGKVATSLPVTVTVR